MWVGVDLDGTIAEPAWTPENPTDDIGEPMWDKVAEVEKLVKAGYKIVIWTARAWTNYEAIEMWLDHYSIPWHRIECGKLLVKAMFDDRMYNANEKDWLQALEGEK